MFSNLSKKSIGFVITLVSTVSNGSMDGMSSSSSKVSEVPTVSPPAAVKIRSIVTCLNWFTMSSLEENWSWRFWTSLIALSRGLRLKAQLLNKLPDCIIALWSNPRAAVDINKTWTATTPSLGPMIVTSLGVRLKNSVLCCTHWSAKIMSFKPKFPGKWRSQYLKTPMIQSVVQWNSNIVVLNKRFWPKDVVHLTTSQL